jgi:hypothetical protein
MAFRPACAPRRETADDSARHDDVLDAWLDGDSMDATGL